jgi:hypothetical protein
MQIFPALAAPNISSCALRPQTPGVICQQDFIEVNARIFTRGLIFPWSIR